MSWSFRVVVVVVVVVVVLLIAPALFARVAAAAAAAPPATRPAAAARADGYRGIWFTLGQRSAHGDKYSGGLGTYTANHVPMAVYAAAADTTFFVYGGTTAADRRHLLCMAGAYDHRTGRVARPVVVHDKQGVDDPHDNPAINLDEQGYVWVFVSGRGQKRPGYKYRSTAPYRIDAFERVEEREMTYPQVHVVPGKGFVHLFTKYTKGRELYWETSPDGRTWGGDQKLAGMGGHYQVSGRHGGRIGTAFMYHSGGDVDRRTNLYYLETGDLGRTWTTADGRAVRTPVTEVKGPPLVVDYEAAGLNVYIHDLNFDAAGRPVILYVTSKGAAPGPQNGPYTWRVTHWTGAAWETRDVTTSDHNYDTGSLSVDPDTGEWRVVGPTDPGPQPNATGGEMVAWTSDDRGATWRRAARLTEGSTYNHSYARRPLNARDPFVTFWADGDPTELSPSRLYFADGAGERVWQLPFDMPGGNAEPVRVKRGAGAAAATRPATAPVAGLFDRQNLVAWCIVPFDARNRTPAERADMLRRLGFARFAYDWRAEHVPTFDAEIAALKERGVTLQAFWFPTALNADARAILAALERNKVRPELWVTLNDAAPKSADQAEKVAAAARAVRPIAEAAAAAGCKVGLYNHGGWGGEPENMLAVVEHLNLPNVGIVYNLHHGHDHVDRLAAVLPKLKPHLLAVNLNGMTRGGDRAGKKILPLGQGELDLQLLKAIRDSGYTGPIGILGHTQDDAEARLRDNLDGLDWLVPQLDGGPPPGPRPTPRTVKPAAAPPGTAP